MLLRLTMLLLRLLVAVAFIMYGTIKLLGGQFIFNKDWVIDSRTTDGPTLVWSFYGYSPVYGRLIGLAELLPAIMLLIPRTRLLGALALCAVSANITVMDFCFDFPGVKYTSLVLTVLCGVLVASDWRKLRLLFWSETQLDALHRAEQEKCLLPLDEPAKPRSSRRSAVAWIAGSVIMLPVTLFGLNVIGDIVSPEPQEAAFAYCMEQGWRREDLRLQSWRGTGWGGFNRWAEVRIQTTGSSRTIRIELYKTYGFAAWRVTDFQEE